MTTLELIAKLRERINRRKDNIRQPPRGDYFRGVNDAWGDVLEWLEELEKTEELNKTP